MKKNIYLSILLSLCVLGVYSQDILTLSTNVRGDAMGGIGISQSVDAFSLFNYGGAIVLDESKAGIGYVFGANMPSLNLHVFNAVSGYYKPTNNHSFSIGVRHLTYPKMDITDNDGIETDTYRPYDFVIDLGYGYAINSHWSAAANIRYVKSAISKEIKAGNAFGFDVGAYARYSRVSGGFSLSNIGSSMKYGDVKAKMPSEVRLGGNYVFIHKDKHQLNGGLEMSYAFLPNHFTGFEAGVGAEYVFDSFLALRGGYHLGNSDDAPDSVSENYGSSLSYGTAGIGLNFKNYSLDMSYVIAGSDSAVKNSVKASFCYKF